MGEFIRESETGFLLSKKLSAFFPIGNNWNVDLELPLNPSYPHKYVYVYMCDRFASYKLNITQSQLSFLDDEKNVFTMPFLSFNETDNFGREKFSSEFFTCPDGRTLQVSATMNLNSVYLGLPMLNFGFGTTGDILYQSYFSMSPFYFIGNVSRVFYSFRSYNDGTVAFDNDAIGACALVSFESKNRLH